MPITYEQQLRSRILEVERQQRGVVFFDEILVRYEPQDKQDLELLESHLERITPKVKRFYYYRRDDGGFEWESVVTPATILIATIAIVVGRGLLDGFLKEFGADGAKALKRTLKTLFEKERSQFTTIFPKGAPIARKELKTPLLSITLYLGIGRTRATFTFPLELTKTEVRNAMNLLPDTVISAQRLAEKKERKSGTLKFKFTENSWKVVEAPKRIPRNTKRKS